MKHIYLPIFIITLSCLVYAPVTKAETDPSSIKGAQVKKPDMARKDVEAYKDVKVVDGDTPLPTQKRTFIGKNKVVKAKYEDTLLELGRKYNLGYVEMVAANPGVDPWLPGEGTKIILPKQHLLPDVPHEGIVINLAEMRMYDFVTDPQNPKTFPIGIGREGLNTPLGQTTVVRKMEGPSWRPTPRMRKEKPELPAVVPPGEDNPLGTHALYLGWPQYLIHGTHKPLGVGRRVSSGCIRMYPEDIIKVFEEVPNGTKVTVIKEPIKFAWIDDMLYMEAHAEDELADSYEDIGQIKEYRVPETLFADVTEIAGDEKDRLNWQKIREAVKTRNGLPIAILTKDKPDETVEVTKDILNIADEDEAKPVKDAASAEGKTEIKEVEPVKTIPETLEPRNYNLNS